MEAKMTIRPVNRLSKARPTLEGAGVHLRRAFGFGTMSEFDSFLPLDDFRNDIPEDYIAGFPWHPHRGIETITCVLAGTVEHGDSMGNSGSIGAGDVQWMTAGRGDYSSGDAQTGGLLAKHIDPPQVGYFAAFGIELGVVGLSIIIGTRKWHNIATETGTKPARKRK
jgi:hypothetical protein